MSLVRISLMALILASATTYSASPPSSDQYEPPHAVPVAAAAEATDQQHVRQRRYYDWPYQNLYQPQPYPISRPYVIPVWGRTDGSVIYYAPQPIQPDRTYLPPPGYLPPKSEGDDDALSPPKSPNRFGEDDDTPLPIWGSEPINPPPQLRPSPSRPSQSRPSQPNANEIPTRPPLLRETTTVPPLVHRPELPANQQRRTTTTTTTTTTETPRRPRRPSRCVWAVPTCCQAGSPQIRYNCFEQSGCVGAFWDTNPCSSDFVRAALDLVSQYYDVQY